MTSIQVSIPLVWAQTIQTVLCNADLANEPGLSGDPFLCREAERQARAVADLIDDAVQDCVQAA